MSKMGPAEVSARHQTFVFGGYIWDIDVADRLLAAREPEVVDVPLSAVGGLLGMVRIDGEYASSHPSPDAPIVLAQMPTEDGFFHLPIDGWHRIAHRKERGAKTISAVSLTPLESYQALVRGEAQYRRLAKKIDPGLKLRKR